MLVTVSVVVFQAKELQTLHNLRKLFVQDLQARVKKVRHTCGWTHSNLVTL